MIDNAVAPDVTAALTVAQHLIASGVPLFLAQPAVQDGVWNPAGGHSSSGYWFPRDWQHTALDPSVPARWRPGMALGAVMGHGLDLLDVDPRNGGDLRALDGAMPVIYGIAATPSGGLHAFIRSLGVHSRDDIAPGIDVKAGVGGDGHGFAFLAPTVRKSKSTGVLTPYSWVQWPDTDRLAGAGATDGSGARLAELVRAASAVGDAAGTGSGWTDPDVAALLADGVPDGASQDAVLRDFTWKLRAQRLSQDVVLGLWRSVVEQTPLTRPGEPWTDADFLRHWNGAERKLSRYESLWPAPGALPLGDGAGADAVPVVAPVTTLPDAPADPVAIALAQANAVLGGMAMYSDSRMSETVAHEVLTDRFCYCRGLGGWLEWDGRVWLRSTAEVVREAIRKYAIIRLAQAHTRAAAVIGSGDEDAGKAAKAAVENWTKLLTAARLNAIRDLCAGQVSARAEDFDADPDALNTPAGIVDLRTGATTAHDSHRRFTKITRGSYRPGYRHPDWEMALQALPEPERRWLQVRYGQAATGHPTPDDLVVVEQGGGENGKGVLGTDGVVIALGDYGSIASPKLASQHDPKRTEHSTEMADLKGQRLLIGEELAEGSTLNMTMIKRITGLGRLTARLIAKDNMRFDTTHSLFMTTNPIPAVTETDHGSWRRLALLKFPYTFRKPHEDLELPTHRRGDLTLKPRIKAGEDGQHDAIITWVVDGALRLHAEGPAALTPTEKVRTDTEEWRRSADKILAFWDDMLFSDDTTADWGITAEDLLETFNAWLGDNRNVAWSMATFTSRFSSHEETTRAGVAKGRPLDPSGWFISRPPARPGMLTRPLPQRPTLWRGVRFREAADELPKKPGQTGSQAADLQVHKIKTEQTGSSTRFSKSSSHVRVVDDPVSPVSSPPASPVDDLAGGADDHGPGGPAGALGPDPEPSLAVTEEQPTYTAAEVDRLTKPRRVPSPEKALAKATEREAKRLAAIDAAAGPTVTLPAAVGRNGEIIELTTAQVATLLEVAVGDLTVDVETTGYPIGHEHYALRLVQLGNAGWAIVFDPDDPGQATVIRHALAAAHTLRAYSATADTAPLAHAGLADYATLWAKMSDAAPLAVIAQPMGGQFDSDSGLKANAARYLPDATAPAAEAAKDELFKAGKWLKQVKVDTPVERSGWAQAPRNSATMVRYAASDVLDTAKLAHVLPDPGAAVRERERAIGRAVAPVSYRGIRLDVDRVEQLATEHEARRTELGDQLRDVMGIDNPGSPTQVAGWLTGQGVSLPQTDAGNASVKAEVLAGLVRDPTLSAVAGSVLEPYAEYVKIGKRLQAFLTPWFQMATRGDGRLRTTVYTLGAEKTGRMSSVRPNMQQVPSQGPYRDCIMADDGFVWVGADFGQVEIRFGAILSGDVSLKDGLRRGLKVHDLIAAQVYGADYTEAQRNGVKRGVFGWLYGAGKERLAAQIDGTVADAEAMVATLRSVAPGLAQWVYAVRDAVKAGQLPQFQTYSGRWITIGAAHSAPNYLIQGSAREALGDGLIKLESTPYRGAVILPVHDEILMHVPEDQAVSATATLKECMEQTMEGVDIIVEVAEPSIRWPKH